MENESPDPSDQEEYSLNSEDGLHVWRDRPPSESDSDPEPEEDTNPLNIPAWLTEEKFTDILIKYNKCPNFKKINNMEISSALTNGENFISSVFRVELDVLLEDDSIKQEKFVLKVPLISRIRPNNDYHELFITEADMHANKVQELEKICADAGLTSVQFAPKHYIFPNPPEIAYILMDDLKDKGFSNADRMVGLDEVQTKAVLDKLALWHAASARRVELLGPYSKEIRTSYFGADNTEMLDTMNTHYSSSFEQCMYMYAIRPRYKLIIERYILKLTELYVQFGEVDDNSFNVLNHGDCWISNFLFKNLNDISDVQFIDFQMPKYGTPALDLFTFLLTSPKFEIKLPKFNDFIEHYHVQLVKNLKSLKYESHIPDLSELHANLKEKGVWGFVAAQRMLAVAVLDSSENANMEKFLIDTKIGLDFKKRMFFNPRFVIQIEKIFPWLIENEYIGRGISGEYIRLNRQNT